jgi:NitT/TauT family transport system substrate-binding protein
VTLRGSFLLGCLLLQGCAGRRDQLKPIPVRMMVGRSIAFLPVLLAERLGLYEKEGLAASIDTTPVSTTTTTQALLGGSVDVAGGLYEQTLSTAVQGQIITSFVDLLRGDFRALVVSPEKSNQIRRVEDLKGAVIGVSAMGSPNQFFVTSIVRRHGMQGRDVSIVAIGSFTRAVAALERSRVDAAVLSGPPFTFTKNAIPRPESWWTRVRRRA